MSKLFCDRPHAKGVDFDTAQFVVCLSRGLLVDGVRLARGALVPAGALSARALRCEYEPPVHSIELLEYALLDDDLKGDVQMVVAKTTSLGVTDAAEPVDALTTKTEGKVPLAAKDTSTGPQSPKKSNLPVPSRLQRRSK